MTKTFNFILIDFLCIKKNDHNNNRIRQLKLRTPNRIFFKNINISNEIQQS